MSDVCNALLVLFMVRIIKQPPGIVGINAEFGVVVRENIYYFQDVVDQKLT